jgi:hypothetical protein
VLVAVGHAILVIVSHGVMRQAPYQEWGVNYCDAPDRQAVKRRLVWRLGQLGYQLNLHRTAAPVEAAFSE